MLDRRLLREMRPAGIWLALTVCMGLLGGLLLVWQARLLSDIISQAFLAGRPLSGVAGALVALLAIGVGRAGASWVERACAQRVSAGVKLRLRERLLAHLFALGPAYTRQERSGELAHTAVEGVERLDDYLSQYVPQVALATLVPLIILAAVFPLDPLSGLVMALTAPVIPVFMVLIGNVARDMTRRQWTSLSRMSAHFADVLRGLTTLRMLGHGRAQSAVVGRISDRFRRATMRVLRVAFLSAMVLEMTATVSTAVVAVEVGLRLLYGTMTFRNALFVLLLAPEFYLPLRTLGTRFHAAMAGAVAARRIFEVLDLPAPMPVSPAPGASLRRPARLDIAFDDVTYAYAGDEGQRPALHGASFAIHEGEYLALVGLSGAGKTTIAHLLLRFITPDSGEIRVDGIPLESLDAGWWRERVSWVPQHPYLFGGSVMENIRLARPDASPLDIVHAARQAHAHDFIQTLPQGYDTLIGERGARLSGGQAQRIALARAFLRDAPLLLCDEATSALDPEHEDHVRDALEHLSAGRTVLVIAHRLATVRRADRILVLDHGKIVESGNHAALLDASGLYRELVTANGAAT